jgi:hypothetical protein
MAFGALGTALSEALAGLGGGGRKFVGGRWIQYAKPDDERAYCKRCGLVMNDSEPMGRFPEWRHKMTGRCVNDGFSFSAGSAYVDNIRRKAGVVRFVRKRNRRRRRR